LEGEKGFHQNTILITVFPVTESVALSLTKVKVKRKVIIAPQFPFDRLGGPQSQSG
jgi:hypothetical protein